MYIGNIKGIADFLGKGIDDINQHLSFNQFKVGSIKHRNAQRKMATKTGMTDPQEKDSYKSLDNSRCNTTTPLQVNSSIGNCMYMPTVLLNLKGI